MALHKAIPSLVRNRTLFQHKCSFSKAAKTKLDDLRRGERIDSVTPLILDERRNNIKRIEESISSGILFDNEEELILKFKKLGLGRKKIGADTRRLQFSEIGGQGSATFLSSCTKPPWPRFKHMLPEVEKRKTRGNLK